MVVVIFAALPLVSLKGEHVVFDSLDAFLPSWVRKFQQALIHIACAALLFGLAYLMWQTGGQFAITGETTAQLKITKAPFIQGMGLLCGLAGLVHLAKAFYAMKTTPLKGAQYDGRLAWILGHLCVGLDAHALGLFHGIGRYCRYRINAWLDAGHGQHCPSGARHRVCIHLVCHTLFILMGNFVARAGLAHELFHAAYTFIGHRKGGLAHATIAACAGFGAICGSSIATAATMGKVAYPP